MTEKAKEMLGKEKYGLAELKDIIEILRGEGGCPWDREQNHKSIRNDFIEETYEAVEAIDNDDPALLREELGDVLLQIVFHAVMAEEEGKFSLDDVCDGISRKLIERHPHVFSDVKVSGSEEVLVNWEKIKNAEKSRDTVYKELKEVCSALPSLMRSQKLAKRLIKSGEISGQGEKITEEELGEKLFELTVQAHKNGLNAEQALYNKCENIIKKYK